MRVDHSRLNTASIKVLLNRFNSSKGCIGLTIGITRSRILAYSPVIQDFRNVMDRPTKFGNLQHHGMVLGAIQLVAGKVNPV